MTTIRKIIAELFLQWSFTVMPDCEEKGDLALALKHYYIARLESIDTDESREIIQEINDTFI